MITLVNANRMVPPIAPIGLDYVAAAARRSGWDVEILDLGLAPDPGQAIADHFRRCSPELVGVSFRNVDESFWPSAAWFMPQLVELVENIRRHSEAPIVLGGVGYSIFAREILLRSGADFGIRGDGEQALISLASELRGSRQFARVAGLLWRADGVIHENPAAWPEWWSAPPCRDAVNNPAYFQRGGQIGVETRRGCPRRCLYCADPLAKGSMSRLRDPAEAADEVETLLAQGVDVLHLCDSEFNIPLDHALAVCEAWIRRGLGDRVRWYAYLAVVPFNADLARAMRRAGCVGINFTADSIEAGLLRAYGHPHRAEDLADTVRLCRTAGIAVMLDLLLGGPGETPETVSQTLGFVRRIGPDCAGAALGIRLYPGTGMTNRIAAAGPLETNPGIRRRYEGPIDLLRPTFYVSPALGERPAQLVRELIGGDPCFFPPVDESSTAESLERPRDDHNYNDNEPLVRAIAAGARGAYWDILRKLRPSRRAEA